MPIGTKVIFEWNNYRVVEKFCEDKYIRYSVEHKEYDSMEDPMWVLDLEIAKSLLSCNSVRIFSCYSEVNEDFKQKVIRILGTLFEKLEKNNKNDMCYDSVK
jgi:hypothetical protein